MCPSHTPTARQAGGCSDQCSRHAESRAPGVAARWTHGLALQASVDTKGSAGRVPAGQSCRVTVTMLSGETRSSPHPRPLLCGLDGGGQAGPDPRAAQASLRLASCFQATAELQLRPETTRPPTPWGHSIPQMIKVAHRGAGAGQGLSLCPLMCPLITVGPEPLGPGHSTRGPNSSATQPTRLGHRRVPPPRAHPVPFLGLRTSVPSRDSEDRHRGKCSPNLSLGLSPTARALTALHMRPQCPAGRRSSQFLGLAGHHAPAAYDLREPQIIPPLQAPMMQPYPGQQGAPQDQLGLVGRPCLARPETQPLGQPLCLPPSCERTDALLAALGLGPPPPAQESSDILPGPKLPLTQGPLPPSTCTLAPRGTLRGASWFLQEGLLSRVTSSSGAVRGAGSACGRQPLRLRAWRVGQSPRRPWPRPGWQGVGARDRPRLQAAGTDCPGPSKGPWAVAKWRLYGFPAGRGTWLRKPLSPHNGPGWNCGPGPQTGGT